jgi:hypothetical protein
VDKSRASLFHSLFVNTPPPSPPLSLKADRSTCSFSVAKLKRSLDDLGLHDARSLAYKHEQATLFLVTLLPTPLGGRALLGTLLPIPLGGLPRGGVGSSRAFFAAHLSNPFGALPRGWGRAGLLLSTPWEPSQGGGEEQGSLSDTPPNSCLHRF